MKFLFKNKRKNTSEQPATVAKGLQSGYRCLKSGWAAWMTKHTAGFSPSTWKVILIVFILSSGGYNIYLAVNAIVSKPKKSISVTSIKKPAHATETGDANTTAPQVSEAEYMRIRKFRTYMDSLARSPSGKIIYDSITRHRPGLMDSVRLVENYYEQLKRP